MIKLSCSISTCAHDHGDVWNEVTLLSVCTTCFCPQLSLLPSSMFFLLSRGCNKDMDFSCNQTKRSAATPLFLTLAAQPQHFGCIFLNYLRFDSLGLLSSLLLLLFSICSCWTKSLLPGICLHITLQQVVWWCVCVCATSTASKQDNFKLCLWTDSIWFNADSTSAFVHFIHWSENV